METPHEIAISPFLAVPGKVPMLAPAPIAIEHLLTIKRNRDAIC